MTRDEVVAIIQQQLAFRTTLSAEIVTNLKLAQIALEKLPDLPWFLISEDTYATTTAEEERLAIPSDFICEVEDATFKYRPDDWPDEKEVDLEKQEYDLLRKNYADVEAGSPEAYALLGNYFRIFPLPDAAYQVRLIYYKQATTLDTNIENVWTLHTPHLIAGTAGLQIAQGPLRDAEATKVFQSWIAMDMAAIMAKNNARQMANREMQMGGRHY